MSDVQRIEASVGKHNPATSPFVLGDQFAKTLAGDNLRFCFAHQSGTAPGGFVTNGLKEFLARNGRRSALHHHQPAGNVGDMRGLQR